MQGLVYIELISRRPEVSVEAFHFVAGRPEAWSGEYEQDALVLNLGRTFRAGPLPEYVTVWYTRGRGLERIGEWEEIFDRGDAVALEEIFALGARIDRAGCFEALLEPVPRRDGLYYAEFLEFAAGADRGEVTAFYEERRDRSGLELNLLCDRIGMLGPGARALAIWNVGSWDRLQSVAVELDGLERPVELVDAGIYRDVGSETL